MNLGHARSITGVLEDKGALDCSSNPNYPAASAGHTYRVSVAGKIGGASGIDVLIGDVIRCKSSNAGGTHASVGSGFDIMGVKNPEVATDCSANPNYPASSAGQEYRVSVAGKIGGASGVDVLIGDVIRCKTANAGGTHASVGSSFDILGVKNAEIVVDCSANPNYAASSIGQTYRVSVAGKIGGASGPAVAIGDRIRCKTASAAGTHASVGANFDILASKSYAIATIGTGTASPTVRPDSTRWADRIAIAGKDFGLTVDGVTDMSTLLNNLMADLDNRGGGVVELPQTAASSIYASASIDNYYPNVLVRGTGRHTGIGTISAGTRGTTIKGAAGITVLKHRTPSGSGNPQRHGGGFKDIAVLNGARGLHVTSRSGGIYHVLFSSQTGTEAMLMDCLTSPNAYSITQTVADYGDNQHFDLDVVLDLTGSTHGVVLSSDSNGTLRATANTSIAHGLKVRGAVGTGYGVVMDCTDNLLFDYIRVFGAPLLVKGVYNAGAGGDIRFNVDNEVHWIGSSTAVVLEGTDTSGCDAGAFLIINHLDFGNANPQPTVGTGAYALVKNGLGIVRGALFRPIAIGEDDASAYNMRNENWAEDNSMWIQNTMAGGYIMIFENSGHRWGIKQDGADIDFVKIAGAGGGLKINGALITEGAADSGGSGYALLRVPN